MPSRTLDHTRVMTADDYQRARRALMRRDPVLRQLIVAHGACGLDGAQRPEHFLALARVIVGQQLSTKAAQTIFTRVVDLMPERRVTPSNLLALDPEALRGAGLSRQKLTYLRDLATRVLDGSVALDTLDAMRDDEVIETLTKIKGFGRWSAEMFLMFRLQRPDVLPVGDLGIIKAIQRAYRLRKPPTPDRILRIGEAWRPYRSIACWYLWRSLDNAPVK